MDFNFFEKLTTKEANSFLKNFLSEAEKGFELIKNEMEQEGVFTDFSYNSINIVFDWITGKLKSVSIKPDENIPDWIQKTETYKKGLYDFDETSKILILRAAYYLGETFIKNNNNLYWNIGKKGTAVQKMPVIKGFKNHLELSPLLVSENLFRNIHEGKSSKDVITMALKYWKELIIKNE